MISPNTDKQAIKSAILSDPYILSLGFSAQYTVLTNSTDETLSTQPGKKMIFIYHAPSRGALNDLDLNMVMQIDVFAPLSKQADVDNAAEQIIALLQDYQIGGHSKFKVVAPSPVPLACPSGFYCVAVRFSYYASTVNTVKTV